MSEPELKPCLRCGGALTIHENDWCVPSEWSFQCAGCGLSGKQWPTEVEAIADANRRPDEALEEAAKVADDEADDWHTKHGNPARRIATAIRALKETKP